MKRFSLDQFKVACGLVVAIGVFTFSGCERSVDATSTSSDSPQAEDRLFPPDESGPEYVPGEVLVKFAAGTTAAHRAAVAAKIGGKVAERILTRTMAAAADNEGITLLNTSLEVPEAVAQLRATKGVEYAEPNFIYHHGATSNDPYYTNGSLWGMYGSLTTPKNQYGIDAATAWANGKTGSSSVYVGIIDEGYMYTHLDLGANAGMIPGEIAGDRVDNDGNGYVDDVYGWDFDKNDNTIFDGTADDHGTHVAGTIGAVGGNGIGVAGVNWNVKFISAKFLGTRGGTTANAIKAVDYITNLKTKNGLNIVATNNSWGGGGFSQGLQDAIDRANKAGILFIAAAGNGGSDGIGDNNDVTANYPSNYPNENVIAVAAITSSGALSSFSNYGLTQVDIGAPGSGIYSTLPGKNNSSTYGSYSGTSMATPHVTGAVALYASTHPTATAAEIKAAILGAAIPTASLAGKCVSGGRLNVAGF